MLFEYVQNLKMETSSIKLKTSNFYNQSCWDIKHGSNVNFNEPTNKQTIANGTTNNFRTKVGLKERGKFRVKS